MEQSPISRLSRWLKRLIQFVGTLVLAEGARNLADLLQAHTCGLNRFELRDGGLLAVGLVQLAAGVGSVVLKGWGRVVMLLYLCGHSAWLAFTFFVVLRLPNVGPSVLNWVLMGGIFTYCGALIVLYWRGWRRLRREGIPGVSWKWRMVGGVALAVGVAGSWMVSIVPAEDVESQAGLDGQFL